MRIFKHIIQREEVGEAAQGEVGNRQGRRFSVVIPTHNRDEFLRRALDSVAAQTFAPHELFVTDDTCRDEVKHIVEVFAETVHFPVYYLPRLDYAEPSSPAAITEVSHLMTGDVLAMLDDDDWWVPGYLETVNEAFGGGGADLVVSAMTNVDAEGRTSPGKCVPEEYDEQDWLLRNPGAACSNVCVDLSVFRRMNGLDGRLTVSSDRDFFIRCMDGGLKLAVLKDRLVMISKSGEGLTRTQLRRILISNFRFYRKHLWRMKLLTMIRVMRKVLNWVRMYFQYGNISHTGKEGGC